MGRNQTPYQEPKEPDPWRPVTDDEKMLWWEDYDKPLRLAQVAEKHHRPLVMVHLFLDWLEVLRDEVPAREATTPNWDTAFSASVSAGNYLSLMTESEIRERITPFSILRD